MTPECTYEMPLETENSYIHKIESGKITVKEEIYFDENWISDIFYQEQEL